MRRLVPLLCLVFLVALAASFFFSVSHTTRGLTVAFLDVGQGDAIFIEAPSGTQVLVDGGKNDAVLRELSAQMSFWDRTLDVVIATHPDLDHIGGLPSVFARYRVERYFESGVLDDGADYRALREALEDEGLEPSLLKSGMTLELAEDVSLIALFPTHDATHMEPNAASLVLLLTYGDTAFLLTGDAPAAIEKYLVDLYGDRLRSNVLKLGHHGSKTSSGAEFLNAVSPDYAVISAGCDNKYGHPHQDVLARVYELGARIAETCSGTVTFRSDGATIQLLE